MELITSTKNPTIKLIKQLARRQFRDKAGLCYIEGIQHVLRALENGLEVETIIYAPDLLKSDVAIQAIAHAAKRGVRCLAVATNVFESISERENPVGLGALAKPRFLELAELNLEGAIFAALHEVKNPGNLGTIVRTIDSIGGKGVILIGNTADPYDPACIKASMGTVFNIPVVKLPVAEEFLQWCNSAAVQVVTTSAKAEHEVAQATFSFPCAVLLGTEGHGLPDELLQAGDLPVRIPMYGQASSLNLAVAAGIILYEVRKQLRV